MTAAAQWLISSIGPSRGTSSCGMTALARMRLFRESRLVSAAVMLSAFPVMAAASGESPALIASLLLLGVLPAVAALDMNRPARIDRAVLLSLVIIAVVLAGGVLRGFPGIPALLVMAVAGVEAFIVGSRRLRRSLVMTLVAAFAALGLAMLHTEAVSAASDGFLTMAVIVFSVAVTIGMLTRGMLGGIADERNTIRGQQLQRSDLEAAASEVIVAVNSSGSVLRASGNAIRILGLSSEALMGRGLAELILVADRPAFLSALSESVHGAKNCTIRVRMRSSAEASSPRYRWVAVSVSQSGTASETAIAAVRDIDAQVLEEQRLEAAAAEVEAAKSARAAFLATVNHELRTPLNAIIGFSDILANPKNLPVDSARTQEYAGLINGAGRDLLRMVCAMIDITRLDSGIYEFETETQDLNALVESAVETFRQEPEAQNARFAVKTPAEAVEADVDARAIHNVLLQLLSNAAKFGGAKSVVNVTVTADAQCVAITVEDRGPGISHEKLALLGRNFAKLDERLNREQGGIGLGLSLACGLMALHGGRIAMDSQLGKGTVVTLSLPRTGAALAAPDLASPDNVHSLASSTKTTKDHSPALTIDQDRRIA
jgi:two-component system, cell cycle sensor histidine kinase DivJ